MITTFGWPKPLPKFGLTDDTGHELVPPVFDDLIITRCFIFAKRGDLWANITNFTQWKKAEYKFSDVSVYESIALTRTTCNGKWGIDSAMGIEGEHLYDEMEMIEGTSIIAGRTAQSLILFNSDGEKIFKRNNVLELSDFESGYALATVSIKDYYLPHSYSKQFDKKMHYVLRHDGIIVYAADDMEEGNMHLNDFRRDFESDRAWSRNS